MCNTFARYSSSFTGSLNAALRTLEEAGVEAERPEMAKRWDFLRKFETNFEHYFNVRFHTLSCLYQNRCLTSHPQHYLSCVQFLASSENVALLPLVTRLVSIRNADGKSTLTVPL